MTSGDAAQWHAGHPLCGECPDELSEAVGVRGDAHVLDAGVVGVCQNRQEVEVLSRRGHGVVRVLERAKLHLRLHDALDANRLARVSQISDRSFHAGRVVKRDEGAQKQARATVTLWLVAASGIEDTCVCIAGKLNTKDLPDSSTRRKDSTRAESKVT